MNPKWMIFCLVSSVAVGLAAIIYIIVDKTSYCRTSNPHPNTAVSEDNKVVCLPGYVFSDGQQEHYITCDRPPYWNWNNVPECIKIDETIGWKCPIQSADYPDVTGNILIVKPDPKSAVRIDGLVKGLKNTVIQVIDVDDPSESCYLTKEAASPAGSSSGLMIEGDSMRILGTLEKPMEINETFRFYIRAIGSQHALNPSSRADPFQGVAVFVLEQQEETKAVYSASSTLV